MLKADSVLDPTVLETVTSVNQDLAVSKEVIPEVKDLLNGLTDLLTSAPDEDLGKIDPYLMVPLLRATASGLRVLEDDRIRNKRDLLRVYLEQVRHSLRDIAEGQYTLDDVPTKKTAAWLVDVLDAPQSRVADLLGASPRQLQRWISPSDSAAPHGDDAIRLKIVAKIVNNLRHVLTSEGVLYWFERPHPELKGSAPADLLKDIPRQNYAVLLPLASAARSNSFA